MKNYILFIYLIIKIFSTLFIVSIVKKFLNFIVDHKDFNISIEFYFIITFIVLHHIIHWWL